MAVANLMTTVLQENVGMDQQKSIGQAIGRIPSGVFVVTIADHTLRDGLLASWVSQAAFEPPMISIAIHKQRHILSLLGVGSRFVLNVLSSKSGSVFKNFARPYTQGCDRFEGLSILPDKNGRIVFAESLAYLDCVSRSLVEAGDHVIVLAEVVDGGLVSGDSQPMVHVRSNGFGY